MRKTLCIFGAIALAGVVFGVVAGLAAYSAGMNAPDVPYPLWKGVETGAITFLAIGAAGTFFYVLDQVGR